MGAFSVSTTIVRYQNELHWRIVFVQQDRNDSPWSEKSVRLEKNELVLDPNTALGNFHDWLVENMDKDDQLKKLPVYDHVMAFTAYVSWQAVLGAIADIEGRI